jgi:ABC-type glycerol-3-phosphate transport system substrate-binding protein
MTPSNKSLSRREFLRAAGIAGVGLGLAACAPAAPAAPAAPVAPAATAAPAAPAAAATVPPAAAAAKHKIRITAIPGPAGDNIKYAISLFQKKYPDLEVQLDVAGGAETEYKPNFPQIAISSDRPDAAWYWVDGRQYQDLVTAGALEPLDSIWESEGLVKAMGTAITTKYTSPDSHRYAGCVDIVWYPQVYYNLDIFAKAGVKPPANGLAYESLDEWYSVCDKIRKAGFEPVTVGGKEGWRLGHAHDALLQRMVPQDMLDDLYINARPGVKAKAHYTGAEWTSADKMLKEWYDKGVFAEGDLGRNYAEGRALFVQKKAAMYQDGSWGVGILRTEAPDIKFGWMLYPQVKPEIKPKFLVYGGDGVMIPKKPTDLPTSQKFVAYLLSQEYQTEMAKNGALGLVPSRSDVPESAMQSLDPMVREMFYQLPKVGTSTGWDDPCPGDMAEKSFILFQEMLTGIRKPETVGEELEKMADVKRSK